MVKMPQEIAQVYNTIWAAAPAPGRTETGEPVARGVKVVVGP